VGGGRARAQRIGLVAVGRARGALPRKRVLQPQKGLRHQHIGQLRALRAPGVLGRCVGVYYEYK